jgi:hypothetical protein
MINPIKVPWQHDAMMAAITPVDEAFRRIEMKYGVGRLERLVSSATLEAYRRGWLKWREAIEGHDTPAAQSLGPKMIAALRFMEKEADAAGAEPLSVETWEAVMADGRVLVVVKTTAEASEVGRAAKLGLDAELPPDLTRILEHQRAGREVVVWTMGELARVLPTFDMIGQIKRTWPGAVITSGPVTGENDASDWATGNPVRAIIEDVFA